MTEFAARLFDWWRVHGRHDLPWQQARTPYRVWIAEVMLQQTQVATVIPYFERWMARFPELASLAMAPLDEVLAQWSGLGYYARARNLHRAAQICLAEHHGQLPTNPELLANLPGIGRSTANAIVSQAMDIPLPILDGNVKRLLARHAAIAGWPGKTSVQQALWVEARTRLPATRGADYSQAIMDLGATLCTARAPRCPDCPVSNDCKAFQSNRVAEFPSAKPARPPREQQLYLLLWRRGDAVLLERRPPAGIWGGLWCLPQADEPAQFAARFGLAERQLQPQPEITHRLTHRLLRITPLWTRASGSARRVESDLSLAWQAASAWPGLGLPKPVADMLANLAGPRPQEQHHP